MYGGSGGVFLLLYRQGHLPMIVLLMSFGADPALMDGEG